MTITINNKNYTPVDNWDELSYRQYSLILQLFDSSNDIAAIKRSAALIILKLKSNFWTRLEKSWFKALRKQEDVSLQLNEAHSLAHQCFIADQHAISQCANFLFENIQKDDKHFIIRGEKRLKPPFQKHKGRYAPHSTLENITFMEWAYLDTFYAQYQKKPTPELFHKIIAILYRPIRKDKPNRRIDIRMPLDFYYPDIDQHLNQIAKWDINRKNTVFHYFVSSRRKIIKMYPNFFISSTGASSNSKSINYAHLITDLAGEKFGTVEKVQNQNIHPVLTYLNLFAIREAEKRFNQRLDASKRR